VTITSPGPAPFAVGQTIEGPGIPAGTKIQAIAPGELTLSNNATATASGVSLSAGIPYNATAGEVATVVSGLPKVSAGGGAATVTGGPGDATGSSPYIVKFDTGAAAGQNFAQMVLEGSELASPTGTQLRCIGQAPSAEPEGAFSYQWLSNGQEIPGATSQLYTTGPGDAGKSIQCRVAVHFLFSEAPDAITLTVTAASVLGTPGPVQAPPEGALNSNGLLGLNVPPGVAYTPSVAGPTLTVGGSGGTITCNAGPWSGTPTSYTYQWFRNGLPFGSPVTTAATSNELALAAPDVSTAAAFQCQVTATNAGGSSTRMSPLKSTSPPLPGGGVQSVEFPNARMEPASEIDPVITTKDGGASFEICKANPPSTDVCKTGVSGSNLGQFDRARGISVDNSPGGEGNVYVADDWNFRVQKFTANGEPIMTWGKNVNKTTGGRVCTLASGDACGIAKRNLDATPGIFGGWPYPGEQPSGAANQFQEFGDTVSVDGSGDVYVTDPYALLPGGPDRAPRIQKFDSNANYIGQVIVGDFGGSSPPLAVASDSQGKTYVVGTGEQRAVSIFDSPLYTPEGTLIPFSERDTFHEDHQPQQVAVDPTDDGKIWISDQNGEDICGQGAIGRRAIVAYDPKGRQLDCDAPEEPGALQNASGLAISPSGIAYVTMRSQNKVKAFELPQETLPAVSDEKVSNITTETARVHASVNPGFEPTTYTLEYGPFPCESNPCTQVDGPEDVNGLKDVSVTLPIEGLAPGAKYFYRVVANNSLGEVAGPEHTFTAFPFVDLVNDKCENALERKQTRTAGLLDCRAYELASAEFTGGYDVVSDLAPGQTPFDGHPDAQGKLLYAVRDGGIPNTGSPTNRGPDPYVATRGDEGWTTKYVGIPADGGFSTEPFSSTLADADGGLDTFAFGGPEICSPCFADGSSGTPLRLPDGSLVQGMLGSIPQLAAVPSGYVGNPLSDDGSHYVFGSDSKFETTGDAGGSIYDRNLNTETTQVASTLPNGSTMTGGNVGELDISDDGSRIVVAQRVSIDGQGNSYWHPYMHIGNSPNSVDLAPGTNTGVLYGGMSADGSRVFFSTADKLVGGDTDTSADVYEASVGGGPATLSLVSRKGVAASNSDACAPEGDVPWNKATGTVQDCSAVVLAGSAGVAEDGTVYFVSPELLDGPSEGKADQPNLYVLRPGQQPQFVALIDDSTDAKLHPLPGPPLHPLVNGGLISGLSTPEAITVDQSNGDIYVVERTGGNRVSRFDSTGAPKNFTAGPGIGTNKITITPGQLGRAQVAVDNSGTSPFNGDFYLKQNNTTVGVFAPTGESLGTLTGFGEVCGIAVDQSTGTLYVGDRTSLLVRRFVPIPASVPPISKAKYTETGVKYPAETGNPCHVAADGKGRVFSVGAVEGPLKFFTVGEFAASPPTVPGEEIKLKGSVPPSTEVSVDPSTDDLYVNTGTKIVLFDSTLKPITTFGEESLGGSRGLAVRASDKHVFASLGTSVIEFGVEPEKFIAIDNPAVLNAMADNEVHRYSDFQTTPDGSALFATRVPQPNGYDNDGFNMVYRYEADGNELDCASCLPTEGLPTGNAALPGYGLGITDDLRVFFNSPDQLVMRDTNGELDAYEWKEGEVSLISTGFSTFPSSLLTVTSDGRDAYFFTRETLVSGDVNGQAQKLYDAREGGGFFIVPNSPPCKASDECHGPGTEAAPPPPIGSFRGVGGQLPPPPKKCKKGFVKKHGKCVRKKPSKKKSSKRHRKRAASTSRGGGR
jgi:sugar lactone lactonase YvrE